MLRSKSWRKCWRKKRRKQRSVLCNILQTFWCCTGIWARTTKLWENFVKMWEIWTHRYVCYIPRYCQVSQWLSLWLQRTCIYWLLNSFDFADVIQQVVADELETEKDENDRLKAEINELKTRPQAVSSTSSFGSNDEKRTLFLDMHTCPYSICF